jgi:hypothetical protein
MKEQKKNGKQATALKDAKRQNFVSFEINPYYENLLEMREKRPLSFKLMSPATQLAIAAYIKAKQVSLTEDVRKAAA